jgi:L-ascorbate metabolism protein UlaG (beta-lactamase superfamily)
MELTYFGHSAFQIETSGTTLLFDPFINDNPHAEGVVRAENLDPDVILLSHAHMDHWGDTPDIATRTGAQVVANFEIATYLGNNHGHENVQPMNTGGAFEFDWGRVVQTYARHSSSFPDGSYGGNPNGFILHLEGQCIYFAGDTALFSEMKRIGERHDVDLALMPVGDTVTMGAEDAATAAQWLGAGQTIPLHYGTFPFIKDSPDEFVRQMDEAGLTTRAMEAGETIRL